jgi:hypothetical protein
MSKESDREIWRKLADDTKSKSGPSEDLPKAEDYIEGPLPEDQETAEERARKLEAAKRAEESRKAEDAQRLAQMKQEEEQAKKVEIARKATEKAKEIAAEARKEADARKAAESSVKKVETPKAPQGASPVPAHENLLLLGLINLLQPALEIKLESKKYQRWIKGWDKVIEMHILGEGYAHVLIKDNTIKASLGKAAREPDILLEGEYEAITNYLNGELDPILMFFDFVLLRKIKLVKGLEFKLSNLLSGGVLKQASDLYKLDKILKIS